MLEVPVPKYFIEDRAKELDDRDNFLGALVQKYHVNPVTVSCVCVCVFVCLYVCACLLPL